MESKEEIKVGTIIEVIDNFGDKEFDNTIGRFFKVYKIAVINGVVKYSCHCPGSRTGSFDFRIGEIRKVDFSKFFEKRRIEILIEREIKLKESDYS